MLFLNTTVRNIVRDEQGVVLTPERSRRGTLPRNNIPRQARRRNTSCRDESGEQGRGLRLEGIVSPALSGRKEFSKCHLPLRVGFDGITCCVFPLATLRVIYHR